MSKQDKDSPPDTNIVRFPKKKSGFDVSKFGFTSSKRDKPKEPFFNFGLIPPFTKTMLWALLIIHVIIFLAFDAAGILSVLYKFGFVPVNFTNTAYFHPLVLITPLTSLILHGSWMHLFINFVMLAPIGLYCERNFGTRNTVIGFLLFGLAGNLAYLILSPAETAPVVGVSGALNGLLAITFLHMHSKGMFGPNLSEKNPMHFVVFWIGLTLVMGLIFGQVSWQSHLGGFLAGVGVYKLREKGKIRF